MQETWVWFLGWENPLEKEIATHSNILAWKIPWTRSLVLYSPTHKELDTTEHTPTHVEDEVEGLLSPEFRAGVSGCRFRSLGCGKTSQLPSRQTARALLFCSYPFSLQLGELGKGHSGPILVSEVSSISFLASVPNCILRHNLCTTLYSGKEKWPFESNLARIIVITLYQQNPGGQRVICTWPTTAGNRSDKRMTELLNQAKEFWG